MEILIQYWDLILIVVIAILGLGTILYKYLTSPTAKREELIRSILLDLVTQAEDIYGSKTGKIKFMYVYEKLSNRYKWVKFIPVSFIEGLVDETLQEIRETLEKKGENDKNGNS